MAKWGSVVGGLAACICLLAFAAGFVPGVEFDGNPFAFLIGALVFGGAAVVFHLAGKLVRRLR
ncbi:hypothetical protein [Brevundimonas goettingensis]|uniref:Uncharacterized protein n=1 Tax=Brevundimonas goettingensis TaxID=2774190 RepID=A0A975C1E2_9CAUL|nr:hypothetical protein [Brevundimonas goettingensis]QTC92041.1 hypothetical protein IFJ75_03750 [Brevundimonas goettingensis]